MSNQLHLRKYSIIMVIVFILLSFYQAYAAEKRSQKVYDYAGLLTEQEITELESTADKYSQKRQVDLIILTTKDTQGQDVVSYTEDFYDKQELGEDKPQGNTAILAIDMEHREVYIAGFYKGKEYLDDSRCDLIRGKIISDLAEGNYYDAFNSFLKLSYQYLGIRPGVNPENILFKLWFQVFVALAIAGIGVMIMAHDSGGKYTAGGDTYLDTGNSRITNQIDSYIRTEITKQRKPDKDSGEEREIGDGVSRDGHSHSGSRGSF